MKIELYGPGCQKCQQLEKMVRDMVAELGAAAEIEKVKDVLKIAEAGIMIPPAVKINGALKCSGRLPKPDELRQWITEAK